MSLLFENKTPPPGGLRRLQQRLDEQQRDTQRSRWWMLAPAAAMAALIAVIGLSLSPRAPQDPLQLFASAQAIQPALLRYGVGVTQTNTASDASLVRGVQGTRTTSATLHAHTSDDVILYWVSDVGRDTQRERY